jgi:hypothetical protein
MFVQFEDENELRIIAAFGCSQDSGAYPNQGEVDEDDPRYIAWLNMWSPALPELTEPERTWRDSELESVIWLRDRHRDQLELGSDTTLTVEQFRELLVFMQALRDWPQSEQFPVIEYRPVAPPWIAEQNQ